MRLYLWANKVNYKEYTHRLLETVLSANIVSSPDTADAVAVSVCDISEVGDIIRARTETGLPVLAGGMVSEYPVVNELADWVWHGEVYALADQLALGMHLEDMPQVTTKQSRRLVISQQIDWSRNPIVRVGRRAMYYYVSKGCPVGCKYCLIGNARRYQTIPRRLYERAARQCGPNLMPIAAYNPYGVPDRANIGETLMRKYITGSSGGMAKMIRTGFEFVNPSLSRDLAKGVTIEDFNEAIARAGREGTKMIVYFIAGLEPQAQLEEFFAGLMVDYNSSPAINIVFTYIDPQPMTPLHDLDLRSKVVGIDTKRLYAIATERNKRVRVLPLAGPERSTVRSLLGRATSVEEYAWIMARKRLPYGELMEHVGVEMGHLYGNGSLDTCCARPRQGIIPDYWEIGEEVVNASV